MLKTELTAEELPAKAQSFFDRNLADKDETHVRFAGGFVKDAIRHSEVCGDPFNDNPFRHALTAVIDSHLEAVAA